MSSDGVILQHRNKLIAHLFVDRSDYLLIGNHKKHLSPTTGDCNWENNRNLLSHGVNVWNDGGKNCERAYPDRCERRKSFCGRRILECDQRFVREKRRTRTNHSRRRIDDKSETRNLRKKSHVRRICKIARLV